MRVIFLELIFGKAKTIRRNAIKLVKIDFKENQTYRNRHHQSLIISGLKNLLKVGPCVSHCLVQFLNID